MFTVKIKDPIVTNPMDELPKGAFFLLESDVGKPNVQDLIKRVLDTKEYIFLKARPGDVVPYVFPSNANSVQTIELTGKFDVKARKCLDCRNIVPTTPLEYLPIGKWFVYKDQSHVLDLDSVHLKLRAQLYISLMSWYSKLVTSCACHEQVLEVTVNGNFVNRCPFADVESIDRELKELEELRVKLLEDVHHAFIYDNYAPDDDPIEEIKEEIQWREARVKHLQSEKVRLENWLRGSK